MVLLNDRITAGLEAVVLAPGPGWKDVMSRLRVFGGFFGLFLSFLPAAASASDGLQWVSRYNTNNITSESGAAVVTDSTGCVYVAGTVAVGSSTDYLTLKLSQSGEILWVTNYNGPGNSGDAAAGVAVDAAGNVFVVGYSTFTGARVDLTTVSYDSTGRQRWVGRSRGPSFFTPGDPAFVGVDKDGNVIVTGHSTAFRPTDDFLTIKYSNDGVPVWTNVYNGDGSGIDIPSALVLDPLGNVYVAGTSAGDGVGDDYAVVKYGPAGNRLWATRFNGSINGNDRLRGLALDSANNVYVTGVSPGVGTGGDFVTLKINPLGTILRLMRFGQQGSGMDDAKARAVASGDNVYMTGTSRNAFVTLKYDCNGNLLWVTGYRPPGSTEFPV